MTVGIENSDSRNIKEVELQELGDELGMMVSYLRTLDHLM